MRHEWQPLDAGCNLAPYGREVGRLGRILVAEAVDSRGKTAVKIRTRADQAVKRVDHLAATHHDDAHRADARTPAVGRLEIYGCKIFHRPGVNIRNPRVGRRQLLDFRLRQEGVFIEHDVVEIVDRALVSAVVVGPVLGVDAEDGHDIAFRAVADDGILGETRITARAHRIDTLLVGRRRQGAVIGEKHRTVEVRTSIAERPPIPDLVHHRADVGIHPRGIDVRPYRPVTARNAAQDHQAPEILLPVLAEEIVAVGLGDLEDLLAQLQLRLPAEEYALADLRRVFDVRVGIEFMFAHLVVGIGRPFAQRQHHAVVADIEARNLDIDPVRGDRTRGLVETPHRIGKIEPRGELHLDGTRIVHQVERLIDVALLVARLHLALDVVIQPVGRLADLYVFRIVPARVAARLFEGVLFEKNLFHIGDGDMLHPREILVGIDFGRLRRIEIIIAPRNREHHGQHGA